MGSLQELKISVTKEEVKMGLVAESEYQGRPIIVLKNNEEDKYPFQFGLKKARLILEHIEDIKKFVEKHSDDQEA